MHSTRLGIVFAGTVNCKSDNANPAAPGQTGANPGQIKSTDYPDESSSRIDLGLASMENWLNQPANYVPWYSSGGSSFYSGTWLQLVANAPVGGSAGFYDIVQTDTPAIKYSTYQFNHDYNTMNVNANHVGRHMLCFVVNNHPSNVVVVDVFAQVPVPDRHSDHNDSTYINAAANDFFWRRHPCDNPVTRDERIPGILGWKLHRY